MGREGRLKTFQGFPKREGVTGPALRRQASEAVDHVCTEVEGLENKVRGKLNLELKHEGDCGDNPRYPPIVIYEMTEGSFTNGPC